MQANDYSFQKVKTDQDETKYSLVTSMGKVLLLCIYIRKGIKNLNRSSLKDF